MREILFRGKPKGGGDWLYGHFTEHKAVAQIWVRSDNGQWNYIVDPDTVGQFTGLTDKNGKKIFEGDIIKGDYGTEGVVEFGQGTFDSGIYKYFGWHCKDAGGRVDHNELHDYGGECTLEVIGNIHDNPELLSQHKHFPSGGCK